MNRESGESIKEYGFIPERVCRGILGEEECCHHGIAGTGKAPFVTLQVGRSPFLKPIDVLCEKQAPGLDEQVEVRVGRRALREKS